MRKRGHDNSLQASATLFVVVKALIAVSVLALGVHEVLVALLVRRALFAFIARRGLRVRRNPDNGGRVAEVLIPIERIRRALPRLHRLFRYLGLLGPGAGRMRALEPLALLSKSEFVLSCTGALVLALALARKRKLALALTLTRKSKLALGFALAVEPFVLCRGLRLQLRYTSCLGVPPLIVGGDTSALDGTLAIARGRRLLFLFAKQRPSRCRVCCAYVRRGHGSNIAGHQLLDVAYIRDSSSHAAWRLRLRRRGRRHWRCSCGFAQRHRR